MDTTVIDCRLLAHEFCVFQRVEISDALSEQNVSVQQASLHTGEKKTLCSKLRGRTAGTGRRRPSPACQHAAGRRHAAQSLLGHVPCHHQELADDRTTTSCRQQTSHAMNYMYRSCCLFH